MRLNPTRRTFLFGSTALAFGLGASLQAQSNRSFDAPLAIPPIDGGTMVNGVREYALTLQDGKTEFFEGVQTHTMGINGNYLGPVLRMRTGETVRIDVNNTLAIQSTLHWHGLNVPANADGGPHQVIEPGGAWSPSFKIHDVASTMWYHSHQLHETASQVWAGLAGMIIIDDEVSDDLEIPSIYGADDIPLVLQDRRFNRDGSMRYDASMHDEMAGMIGNVPLINGTVRPHFDVSTEKLRLRLLNGSNASIYNLAFSDGRSFVQIASDGGLLPQPAELYELLLAPGERAEIIVKFEQNERVVLESKALAGRRGGGQGMGMGGGMMMAEQNPQFELIEFRAAKMLQSSASVPSKLRELPDISETHVTNTREFLLEMPGMGPLRMLGLAGGFTINGNAMKMRRVDEVVKMGDTEIWEISNAGPMIHPFHIHNTQFRVLDRDGQSPDPSEAGLKDTVVVFPGETVRLLVRFDNYTDAERPYMYHCHILEHEDAGMMGQFTVV